MKVHILSKYNFESLMKQHQITNDNVELFDKFMFISILNSEAVGDCEGYFENHSNVLVLRFDDVEEEIHWEDQDGVHKAVAFTEDQAKQLIDFIINNNDKEKCIVHCSAGISRSGAVGTFISDYFGYNYSEFRKTNPYILPNGLVLRTLKTLIYNYE